MSRPFVQALLFGIFVAALLMITDELSLHFGLKGSQRIVDDIFGGAIAGAVVFGYARTKLRHMEQQLNTIGLMNHHIRNALQVIRYSGYIRPESQQVAQVEDAIERIEWTLREILPGRITGYDEGWK
jgi:hypothetical protein